MYLLPKGDIDSASMSLISRSRVPLLDPVKLVELFTNPGFHSEHALVQVSLEQAGLLSRYPSQLTTSDMTMVTNVPGLVYRSDWMMLLASIPRLDWLEIEGRLAKSGLTGYTQEQVAAASKPGAILAPLVIEASVVSEGDIGDGE